MLPRVHSNIETRLRKISGFFYIFQRKRKKAKNFVRFRSVLFWAIFISRASFRLCVLFFLDLFSFRCCWKYTFGIEWDWEKISTLKKRERKTKTNQFVWSLWFYFYLSVDFWFRVDFHGKIQRQTLINSNVWTFCCVFFVYLSSSRLSVCGGGGGRTSIYSLSVHETYWYFVSLPLIST